MTGDIDDFFQRAYSRTGGPLETVVVNELSTDFDVSTQPEFIDLDEEKSRSGDVLAKKAFPSPNTLDSDRPAVAEIVLTASCLNLMWRAQILKPETT
jgi:hypothetical protein